MVLLFSMVWNLTGFSQQPNIIFIYADDWGYGDLSLHGHHTITTPNLDQLAAEGTEFLQFNVCNPVCSPSRVAVMTGLYPSRFHIHQHFANHQLNMDRNMPDWLDPSVPMISSLFKEAGYRTAHYGKWHLTNSGVIDPPLPLEYGYDESFVYNGPGPQVGVPATRSTAKGVDNCMDFIERDPDKPFFINLWIHESHAVIDPPQDAKDAYAHVEEPFRSYYACISYADRELGRLFHYLQDQQLDSSTLVIFSSDNGPELPSADSSAKTYYSRGETAGLRGQKRSLFEGGVGVPFIVHWPGTVPAGKINNTSHIAAVDILPSLCAVAGIDLPEEYISDGEDLSESLLGGDQQRKKPLFWDWRGASNLENWPRMAVRSGDWKFVINEDESEKLLFNIQANRVEENDSLEYYPELADSLYRMVSDWKEGLPRNIPIHEVGFYTNKDGNQVIVDFSETAGSLSELMDAEFRLYKSDKYTEIPIDSVSYDEQRIYLHLSEDPLPGPDDQLSIAFRTGKVSTSVGTSLLYFSTEAVENRIQSGPEIITLEFNVFDSSNMFRLPGAAVQTNDLVAETNLNGEAYFNLEEGSYTYGAEKDNYTSVTDSLVLSKDTLINLFLHPTLASVKFRISDGNNLLYQAEVEIDEKKAMSNSVGISIFEDLLIGKFYPYSITKTGYNELLDSLVLQRDTTISAALSLSTGMGSYAKDGLKVFPNPVQSTLFFESSETISRIEICDLRAAVIKLLEVNDFNATIDMTGYADGVYIARIYRDGLQTLSLNVIKSE